MKQHRIKRFLALLLALTVLVSQAPAGFALEDDGSSGDETGAQTPQDGGGSVPVNYGISLPDTLTLTVGEEGQLSVTVTADGSPLDAPPPDMAIKWESDDASRVTVTQGSGFSATVRALGSAETTEREVTVTVSVTPPGGTRLTDACTVTVRPAEPVGVTLDDETLELDPGESQRLYATVSPESEAGTAVLDWSSSNGAIVSVADGTVTAGAVGEAVVTVRAAIGGGNYTDTCAVTVRGILLPEDAAELTFREGERGSLRLRRYGERLQNAAVSWSSSNETVATVDGGYLFPVSQGKSIITAAIRVGGKEYTDSCEITVERKTADAIRASVEAGAPLSFAALQSQIDRECRDVLGGSLQYVSGLRVDSTSQGTLYYQYQSDSATGYGVGSSENYYALPAFSQRALSDVTFVPKADFSGTAAIAYTGYDGQGFFQGTIQVTVASAEDLSYNTTADKAVQFSADDFNRICRGRTGRDLSSVTFSLPDSSRGTLYYNYISASDPGTEVEADRAYRRGGTPSLSNVYFVPDPGYSGQAVISYTGRDVYNTTFRGRVTIRVTAAAEGGDLRYSVGTGGRVVFDDDDFNALSRDLTGNALDYVQFELPDSDAGTLYYNYTSSSHYDSRVTEGRNYYRSSAPYLRRVSFVAREGYTGTAIIPFTAWDTRGNRFSGTVEVAVGHGGSGEIRYTCDWGGAVSFDDNDFNDLCRDLTGGSLSYVRFSLPASSRGTLYYDYDDGDYESRVSSSRSYYRNARPYLDRVSFVPARGYAGTVSIDFTGENTVGRTFSGTVEIDVEESGSGEVILYRTDDQPVTFRAGDFEEACRDQGLRDLESVRFDLPGSSQGTLYYQYGGLSAANTRVRSNTSYYPGKSPRLNAVTFVPRPGYTGTVTIPYSGEDERGKAFEGTVRIVVSGRSASRYFGDLGGAAWAVSAVDLLYENGVVTGTGAGRYSPSAPITRGDFMLMLYRAFHLSASTGAADFPDVPAGSYYAQAIRTARALGIATGYPDGGFHPGEPVSRQDAMVMLHRTMQTAGWSLGGGNLGLLSRFRDGGEVSGYARSAVAVMVEHGLVSGSGGELNPRAHITRAEMAVMLARALTM